MATNEAILEGRVVLKSILWFISEDNIIARCSDDFPQRAATGSDRESSATKSADLVKQIKAYFQLKYHAGKLDAGSQVSETPSAPATLEGEDAVFDARPQPGDQTLLDEVMKK
jgi:hypothetical protein